MAKSAKSDPQAVIDSIRKQQKSAEKRQGLAIVGACVVIAVLIIGAAAYQPIKDWWQLRAFNDLGVAEIGAPASACQDVETKPVTGGAQHEPTGTPVTYKHAPPAFGSHWNEAGVAPATIERKLYTDDRPELESLVHNLEHGYTLLWYNDTIADDEEAMDTLRAIAGKFGDSSNFRNKSSSPLPGPPRTASRCPRDRPSPSPTGRRATARRAARRASGSSAPRSAATRSSNS